MAGLASSLAGKTGTFQVPRQLFFVNYSHPAFEASLPVSPRFNYHLPGFGEKAGPGACRAGKPLWSNNRCLRLQWSLYTSRLQTHPGGGDSYFIIEEHTLCPRYWEQGPTLRPRPILERLFVSCQGKPSTLKLTLVLMCLRWRPEMQLKFSIQWLRIEVQSGLSSRAKHGGPVFSAVSGSIKDLATVPGSYNHLGPWNFMTFAPALVFLTVVNIYSFAIEFGGCICYFWSKWISRAKYLTFPGDGRQRWGWIACNVQWLFMLF